ncbi:MAG: DUF4856 domain-containing protein, partial [Bacteroidota bacterium]
MKNLKILNLAFLLLPVFALVFTSCEDDDPETDDKAGFLASNIDALGDIDLGGFAIPDSYDIDGAFAPGAYNGQIRRIAQLKEIVDSSRNEPIFWDIANAMEVGGLPEIFKSPAAQNTSTSKSDLRSKIDELNFDSGDKTVADNFAELADLLVQSSQANFTVTASNGTAGMITTGDKKRHVSANGLEYAQILEKGMYGPLLYDQMVDDYLRPSQSGPDNETGNNESAAGDGYSSLGTDRQHRFDEAFGYFGANPATYPNPANTSTGDGIFLSNYTFDFSDETETEYGINLSQRVMDAFILGRAALKAGEGFGPEQESTNEEVLEAAIQDVKLYVEAGIAAAAFHYLNDAIADVTDDDKLHHLSEALGFIYSLAFNSEGRISDTQVYAVLQALGWSKSDTTLNGIYE